MFLFNSFQVLSFREKERGKLYPLSCYPQHFHKRWLSNSTLPWRMLGSKSTWGCSWISVMSAVMKDSWKFARLPVPVWGFLILAALGRCATSPSLALQVSYHESCLPGISDLRCHAQSGLVMQHTVNLVSVCGCVCKWVSVCTRGGESVKVCGRCICLFVKCVQTLSHKSLLLKVWLWLSWGGKLCHLRGIFRLKPLTWPLSGCPVWSERVCVFLCFCLQAVAL